MCEYKLREYMNAKKIRNECAERSKGLLICLSCVRAKTNQFFEIRLSARVSCPIVIRSCFIISYLMKQLAIILNNIISFPFVSYCSFVQ